MFYDRKIVYLDYIKNQERTGGADFAKWEVRDDNVNLTLQINGLHKTDTYTKQVLLTGIGVEKELCKMEVTHGKGEIKLTKLNRRNLAKTGLAYEQLTGIRIPIGTGREISGKLFCLPKRKVQEGIVLAENVENQKMPKVKYNNIVPSERQEGKVKFGKEIIKREGDIAVHKQKQEFECVIWCFRK